MKAMDRLRVRQAVRSSQPATAALKTSTDAIVASEKSTLMNIERAVALLKQQLGRAQLFYNDGRDPNMALDQANAISEAIAELVRRRRERI